MEIDVRVSRYTYLGNPTSLNFSLKLNYTSKLTVPYVHLPPLYHRLQNYLVQLT